jgi:glutamate/tyrosine decarboxylase-like PLP-dependent enzyme
MRHLFDALSDADDPLGLETAEMRRLGYWVVDRVVEHFEHVAEGPAIRTGAPADLRAALGGPPPQDGVDALEAMTTLVDVALGHMQHGDHPRYFARVPGPSSFAGVLGDWLGTGFNAMAASWSGGSGLATLELVTLDWLRELLGLPVGTEGVMTSGGSTANMTALAAARIVSGPGVCYLSDQTHASIPRALAVLGFPTQHIRVIDSDHDLRLSPAAVRAAVRQDRAAGRRPGFVVATAGTTNSGAVDPLPALAELCRSEGLWLHVDGAYGASAGLCEAGRRVLTGLELADSLVVDPHKWLFQPYDLGCVLVRHPGVLKKAFQMTPDYLVDVMGDEGEVDFRDRSVELTRRARSLKLWLSFRVYGVRRLAAAIERGIALAEFAQKLVEADDRWEVATPAQLGIITFNRRDEYGDDLQSLAAAVADDGFAAVTSTRLHGRSVLRLCTINPRTTPRDIASTLERLGVRTSGCSD